MSQKRINLLTTKAWLYNLLEQVYFYPVTLFDESQKRITLLTTEAWLTFWNKCIFYPVQSSGAV